MDGGRGETKKNGTNDVVVTIAGTGEATELDKDGSYNFSKDRQLGSSTSSPNVEISELKNITLRAPNSTFLSSPSPEMAKFSPSPNPSKPPKIPTETNPIQRRSLSRSTFSKPKSRFVEPPNPGNAKLAEEKTTLLSSSSPYKNSPINRPTGTPRGSLKSAPVTPKTPLIGSPLEDEEEDEEVYKTANLKESEKRRKKVRVFMLVEWISFVCFMGILISSLTVKNLENKVIWGLGLWKWCVLVLVIFCGRLFSVWSLNVVVFLIERNFLLKKKVLYFVFGLKKSVQIFIWLGLVLLTWVLLINRGVKRSEDTTRILNYVTRALAASLIGAVIWLIKTLLIKILASNYQCTRFFDRIQDSIFHQYIVRILSGPPQIWIGSTIRKTNSSSGHLSFRNMKKEKEEAIDVDKLNKMKQEKVSAWTMKGLVDVIRGSELSTISNTLESSYDDEEADQQQNKEISSEWEAKAAAYRIFRNVAKPGSKYIEEDDLLRFMKREEVDIVLPLFGAAETGKIKRSTLKNWLVHVYIERKSLVHSLNDTKTAIEELNRLLSAVVLILAIIVWLLLMGFLTTKVLVFISSQLVLAAFMFGNAAKTVFEAIIFVFVMHPFDVGDRCVIDGVQMVVEEMNILTTVFLRYDNEKIFYPNSVLSIKPISNFYRSPEMGDSVEFAVHISTSVENIIALKAKIKGYLESKPQHWRPGHSVLVKEIEDVNKMKMALYVTHTINFQNYGDKNSRRSELVLELKKYFEDLGIKYHLLPQEVHLTHVGTANTTTAR